MNAMKNDSLKYGLGGILLGGLIVWLITMTSINSNNSGITNMMGFRTTTQQTNVQNSNQIDSHFIEQMIPHHEDAITMAKLAQTKAQRTEVKQLAENIFDSQSKEIEQMKQWYKEWFGNDVPRDDQVMNLHGMMGSAKQNAKQNSMHMGMMGDERDIATLENAADFDREFVEEMIPHHQMAVMMASMLKGGTQRSEMKKLADDIITAQTNEITQMRQWLKEWGN